MSLEPTKRPVRQHADADRVSFPMKRDDGSLVMVGVTIGALDRLGGAGDHVAQCEEHRSDLEAVAVSKDDGISESILIDEEDV
jgi:hypothetical protein